MSKPRIVVTHWVHPEVASYLAGFSDALIPSREQAVFSPEQVVDLADNRPRYHRRPRG